MSSIDRDRNRKVSQPTEADFISGIANSANYPRGNASFLGGVLLSFLTGKAGRRRGSK